MMPKLRNFQISIVAPRFHHTCIHFNLSHRFHYIRIVLRVEVLCSHDFVQWVVFVEVSVLYFNILATGLEHLKFAHFVTTLQIKTPYRD